MHELVSAACVFRGSEREWRYRDTARLWVRPFGDAFLDRYLARCGDEALTSVGAYQLESVGAQLFSRIEGDWFTILGLPLLPLLDYLRTRQVLTT
jgi:septum formation protein